MHADTNHIHDDDDNAFVVNGVGGMDDRGPASQNR